MDIDAMEAIFQSALSKYRKGAGKYGDYDPLTDRRDMAREAEEEILDAINYLAMFMMKLRAQGQGNHGKLIVGQRRKP